MEDVNIYEALTLKAIGVMSKQEYIEYLQYNRFADLGIA